MKLRDIIKEIQITKVWNLDKPVGNIRGKIKVGDIFQFTLQKGTRMEEIVKQRVVKLVDGDPGYEVRTEDIGANGGADYWLYKTIESYHTKL